MMSNVCSDKAGKYMQVQRLQIEQKAFLVDKTIYNDEALYGTQNIGDD
jgi:hypothetical protein